MIATPSLAPGRNGPAQNSRRPASTRSSAQLAGLIMWLPRLEGLPDHSELPRGCYHHPVVILSEQSSSPAGRVVILILTSFGETDILDKFPGRSERDRRLRMAYLPIHPTAPHPDTGAQLFLEGQAKLRCNTYANTRDQHTVPLDILRPYDRKATNETRYAVTRDSYHQLVRQAHFVPLPVIDILPPKEHQNSIDAATTGTSRDSTTAATHHITRPGPVASELMRPLRQPPTSTSTYGTIAAASRAPAPSSVPLPPSRYVHGSWGTQRAATLGHANIKTSEYWPLIHGFNYNYTPVPQHEPTRQTAAAAAAAPYYRTPSTLPLYHQPRHASAAAVTAASTERNNGVDSSGGNDSTGLGTLGEIVGFGIVVLGLWWVCTMYR
ncbi:hypothetical protein N658DRAFT_289369 [Parathielavia hyrcaniae]|uniref:Uncharacterized protein n=1 Tax=Parathielavia hyrcaniae TaxID=113614 RepID=A0AAN6PTF3_9PEZI|nr:hypothetical protein N658DRAFT_289369 [Parathielavia hyrcaniae]